MLSITCLRDRSPEECTSVDAVFDRWLERNQCRGGKGPPTHAAATIGPGSVDEAAAAAASKASGRPLDPAKIGGGKNGRPVGATCWRGLGCSAPTQVLQKRAHNMGE